MKIEEAIVYVMVKRNGSMTTDQIADAINLHGLHQRKDGQPVTSKQVYLFAWKALLTPTIEKIIFLSSAIFFILLIYVSCHISLFFLHLSVIPR